MRARKEGVKLYKSGLGVRADYLYCPLAFGLDAYWGCEFDCSFCYCRRLNRTWGQAIRPADVPGIQRKLLNPGKGSDPISVSARARKTLRLGNKSDLLQPEAEREFGSPALALLRFLRDEAWEVKLETRSPLLGASPYFDLLVDMKATITISIMIGGSADHRAFAPRSAEPLFLFRLAQEFRRRGHRVSVITEPFIPGYHTVEQWADFLDMVADYDLDAVNLYNLHFNDFVAKRIFDKPGVDIERVWMENEDEPWRRTLAQLIEIADAKEISLGMPDFVNSGRYLERFNTCCAVDAVNPLVYNYPTFKRHILTTGSLSLEDLHSMFEGIGPPPEELFEDSKADHYGFRDMGLVRRGDLWVYPETTEPDPERRSGSGGRRRT